MIRKQEPRHQNHAAAEPPSHEDTHTTRFAQKPRIRAGIRGRAADLISWSLNLTSRTEPGGHSEGQNTRSHPELGRENPQRRWYCVSRRGRVGRRQARQPPISSHRSRRQPTPTHAGWSSPVARQAHNLKVIGSNPIPATKSLHTSACLQKQRPKPPRLRAFPCPTGVRNSPVHERVITGSARRRRCSEGQKRAIVATSLAPGD